MNFKIRTSYSEDESCALIKSFSGSSNSDLTDEEKELCAELMDLQPYKFEPVRELDSELRPDHSEDIEKTSQSQDIRAGNKNCCQCGLCSENEERERDCLCCREVDAIEDEKFIMFIMFIMLSCLTCLSCFDYHVLNFSLPLCSSQLNYLLLLVFI